MDIMNDMLCEAILGESEAERRYLLFAEKAIEEGYRGVAKLFTGLSHGESIHIANHKNALAKNNYTGPFPSPGVPDEPRTTVENVNLALEGEKEEFTRMYPGFYRKLNKTHGESFIAKIALLSIRWAMESEKRHHALLKAAAKAVAAGKDLAGGEFYLCTVCGNLDYSPGRPEQLCPVCGHDLSFYCEVDLLP